MKRLRVERYDAGSPRLGLDYPELYEPGESDGEHITGMDNSYELFLSELSGSDFAEFRDSFNDGEEGWLMSYERGDGIHHVWGSGHISGTSVIVLVESYRVLEDLAAEYEADYFKTGSAEGSGELIKQFSVEVHNDRMVLDEDCGGYFDSCSEEYERILRDEVWREYYPCPGALSPDVVVESVLTVKRGKPVSARYRYVEGGEAVSEDIGENLDRILRLWKTQWRS